VDPNTEGSAADRQQRLGILRNGFAAAATPETISSGAAEVHDNTVEHSALGAETCNEGGT